MATVNDIGVPGQPLSTPPLTGWQAAVRDMLNTHTGQLAASTTVLLTPGTGWTGQIRLRRQGALVHCQVSGLTKAAPVAQEVITTFPVGYRPNAYGGLFTINVTSGSGRSELAITTSSLNAHGAPIAAFAHTGSAVWYTADA